MGSCRVTSSRSQFQRIGKEYTSNKEFLDQVSLPAFSWVVPAPDFLDDEPDFPDHGQQAPAGAQNPQANGNGQPANGLEGTGNGQKAPAHGPGVHLKDPSADGSRNGSNGQPMTGSSPPINGKHQASNGASVNGSAPPLKGQHHSSNEAPTNGPAIPGSDAKQPSPRRQSEPAYGPQPAADSPQRPTQGQSQGLNDLRAALKDADINDNLATRLEKAAQVCSVSKSKMSLDVAQSMISTVLDQAEELQTQIITEAWYVWSQLNIL